MPKQRNPRWYVGWGLAAAAVAFLAGIAVASPERRGLAPRTKCALSLSEDCTLGLFEVDPIQGLEVRGYQCPDGRRYAVISEIE